jgi:hypothetical protein
MAKGWIVPVVLSGAAAAAAGPTTLILDNFTDANGTAVTSHTIAPTNTPATTWAAGDSATCTVESNRASSNGIEGNILNAGVADCTLTATFIQSVGDANQSASIIVRRTNSNNYWMIRLTNGAFQIIELNAGVASTRATAAQTTTGGVAYVVQAVLLGATISATVDGGNPISYGSATLNQTTTNHGFRMVVLAGGTVTCDDYTITT